MWLDAWARRTDRRTSPDSSLESWMVGPLMDLESGCSLVTLWKNPCLGRGGEATSLENLTTPT